MLVIVLSVGGVSSGASAATVGREVVVQGEGTPQSDPTVQDQVAGKKKQKAKLKKIKVSGVVPTGVSFSLRKPMLRGSTVLNRITFAYLIETQVTAELKRQARAKKQCPVVPKMRLTSKVSTSIYKGRYASAAMIFRGTWCSGTHYQAVRSVTLDLKHSRPVKTQALAPLAGKALQWEIIAKLYKTKAYKKGHLGPKGTTLVPRSVKASRARNWTRVQGIEGWLATKKGIRFWVTADYGVQAVTLPWAVMRKTPGAVAGHSLARTFYAGTGFGGVVAPIPAELAAVSVGNAGGRWENAAQGVALTIAAEARAKGVTAAQLVAADDATAAGLGKVSARTWDGKVLTLSGVGADARRFMIRRAIGASGSVRVMWVYPEGAAAWVNVWARDLAAGLRHAPL